MPRLTHGKPVTPEGIESDRRALEERSSDLALASVSAPVDLQDFDFLFPDLQDDADSLLPVSPDTPERLKVLGRTMVDTSDEPSGDAELPAAYTYFGQFIDHDITLEEISASAAELLKPDMTPLSLSDIRSQLRNARTATLDLDSLYGLPAPRHPTNPAKMRIGRVTGLNGREKPFLRPPGKTNDNDLPRQPRSIEPKNDRAALIGDPRNDENLIVSQLHLAFLKAHNALVDQGRTFEEARRILRQHYQHLVLRDFLPRIADPEIVEDILRDGNKHFNALAEPFFMPLEFAVAAYRFGHSLVRNLYDFNVNFNRGDDNPADLGLLFTFTALSGQLGFGAGDDTLPDNWIVEWENLIGDGAKSRTRRFDTTLASPGLFNLRDVKGEPETPEDAASLAVRNLLRGYRLRIPTGQAVARALDLEPLGPQQIEAAAGSEAQVQALRAGELSERTPLWYYILAEAEHAADGQRLGPVGSTIVAEVLIGLVRRSDDSVLRTPGWRPSLPAKRAGRFELADLLRFAGVLPDAPAVRSYKVRRGDTLKKIARQQLGDEDRWPEIFVLNRALIRHPNRIFPGQVLILPGDTPMDPPPRIYVVRRGDTLAKIAQQKLGDDDRWREIFALNGDVITNPNRISPGQVLVLPPRRR